MPRALLSIVLLVAAASLARAQEQPESFRVSDIEPGSTLSVRDRPDAEAEVVAKIPWNARGVRGAGCTTETPSGRTWCRVKYKGAVGWARRRYLQPE